MIAFARLPNQGAGPAGLVVALAVRRGAARAVAEIACCVRVCACTHRGCKAALPRPVRNGTLLTGGHAVRMMMFFAAKLEARKALRSG